MSVLDGKNLYSGDISGVEAMTILNSRGRTQNFGLTIFEAPSLQQVSAVENDNLSLARSKGRIVRTELKIFANTLDGSTTFRVRRHKSDNTIHQDAEVEIIVPAGNVTPVENNTIVPLDDWDLFNMRIVTLGTLGSIQYKFYWVLEWDRA